MDGELQNYDLVTIWHRHKINSSIWGPSAPRSGGCLLRCLLHIVLHRFLLPYLPLFLPRKLTLTTPKTAILGE